MKRQVISLTMAALLTVSAMAVSMESTWAATTQAKMVHTSNSSKSIKFIQNQSDTVGQIEADLQDSANYMMTYLEQSISTADYQISYTDYQDAMFAMKAGAQNHKVTGELNAYLKQKLAAYDETFLNPYGSTGVQSFALAVIILYLEEQGVDVTDYEGINLIERFETIFLAETEPNPYVYQYISAIETNMGKLSDAVVNKVKDSVLAYYVDNENGIGIDYWGVSADNNGQVLTALVNAYATDSAVKTKVDGALAWNAAQKDASGAIVSWGAPNASATAMAMRAAAQFGQLEDAAGYYQAMEQFKSATTMGAYTYYGEDNIYSSRDALIGLLAYRNKLQSKDLFAVTKKAVEPQPTQDIEIPTPSQAPQSTGEPLETECRLPAASEAVNQSVQNVTASSQPMNSSEVNTTQPAAPKTADPANIGLLAAVMTISAGVAVLAKRDKKDCYED